MKSSTKRRKILFKAIVFMLISCSYFLIIKHESKRLIELSSSSSVKRTFKSNTTSNIHATVAKKRINHVISTIESIVESSTLNEIYEYSEEINLKAELDFKTRREHLLDACERNHMKNKLKPNSKEFILTHDLAWCTIFKAASTTFLYFMNILGGYDLKYLQRTASTPIELARKRFPRPTINELNEALENSISFLIVRDPFERLLSAYRNKFEEGKNSFYKVIGDTIVKRFRNHQKKSEKDSPNFPTFEEFLKFIVQSYKNNKALDEHWCPYWKFCTPCTINYTLVLKLDTLKRDTNYLIRTAGLEELLIAKIDQIPKNKVAKITNRSTKSTNSLLTKYFSQIDENLLKEILKIYQLDFDLFDYDSSFYFNVVKKPIMN